MQIPFKKDPVAFNQRSLFATNIFDLLPSDHTCYVYEDIFEQLETSSVEDNYSLLGQNAYHPRLITAILIYAYSQGIFSSREIEKKCHEDLSFMFISHFNCPNFRVLSAGKTTMSFSRTASNKVHYWQWKLGWHPLVM